jgi:hypothetical protein
MTSTNGHTPPVWLTRVQLKVMPSPCRNLSALPESFFFPLYLSSFSLLVSD